MIVAFDIETGGLLKDSHSVLEVGAIAWDPDAGEEVGAFQCYVDPINIVGDPFALGMHQRIFEALKRGEGLTPNAAMVRLEEWLFKVSPFGKPHALGFNVAGFDLQWSLGGVKFADLFHHRSIEVGSFCMGVTDRVLPPSSRDLAEVLKLPLGQMPHCALDDARIALQAFVQRTRF